MNILTLVPLLFDLLDKIVPDKDLAEKTKAAIAQAEQSGELQIALEQIKVNQKEASSKSIFVAGWRPFIGWVCGFAFAYHYVLLPLLVFTLNTFGVPATFPAFDINSLIGVLMGMLGLGGLRTYEKIKGVSNNKL